jgi:hypothetical protein
MSETEALGFAVSPSTCFLTCTSALDRQQLGKGLQGCRKEQRRSRHSKLRWLRKDRRHSSQHPRMDHRLSPKAG